MGQTLGEILDEAACGRFPEADGGTTVVRAPNARDTGVIAFTAHSVVFTDEGPEWVHALLDGADCDALAATMHPRFLTALLDRTGRVTDTIDLLTVATWLPGAAETELREVTDPVHPRAVSARRRRDGVRVWEADGGVLVLGRGVADRWEVAVEVDEGARHRGLGRELAAAARHLVPPGEPLWSQQAAGNARSIRAFQAAGFRPVGSEVLLRPGGPRRDGARS
ncbi:GNAT family N-acetyltransferase [Streptomyces californicus]|uniref:GNAT family N-acetyltransferase n=1 Tax=Streptomyces californicus TaxID=67351 RepID=UPI0036AFCF1D